MEFEDDIVQQMMDAGYLEVVGQNKLGEDLYRFTKKFYREHEELAKMLKQAESDIMSSLWFKGFIDIRMDDKSNSFIYLTEKSDDWYDSDELTIDEKSMMYLIYTSDIS